MQIMTNLRKYAHYVRTKRELQNMPLDVALDLDIDRAAASRIAHKAVYGF
ncbi:hypothetical protein [Aestuariibius sp. HNIBRBA575]